MPYVLWYVLVSLYLNYLSLFNTILCNLLFSFLSFCVWRQPQTKSADGRICKVWRICNQRKNYVFVIRLWRFCDINTNTLHLRYNSVTNASQPGHKHAVFPLLSQLRHTFHFARRAFVSKSEDIFKMTCLWASWTNSSPHQKEKEKLYSMTMIQDNHPSSFEILRKLENNSPKPEERKSSSSRYHRNAETLRTNLAPKFTKINVSRLDRHPKRITDMRKISIG